MAATKDNKSNRGLAAADEKTRTRVAKLGGSAHHEKRGNHGSDTSASTMTNSAM
jgi:hypothetical protein